MNVISGPLEDRFADDIVTDQGDLLMERNMESERTCNVDRSLTALELADAFLEATGSTDEHEATSIRESVLLAGELIAEIASPGHWEGFGGRTFFDRLSFVPLEAKRGTALNLVGFFGWMGMSFLMEPRISARIADDIAKQAWPPCCNEFLDRSLGHLSTAQQMWEEAGELLH